MAVYKEPIGGAWEIWFPALPGGAVFTPADWREWSEWLRGDPPTEAETPLVRHEVDGVVTYGPERETWLEPELTLSSFAPFPLTDTSTITEIQERLAQMSDDSWEENEDEDREGYKFQLIRGGGVRWPDSLNTSIEDDGGDDAGQIWSLILFGVRDWLWNSRIEVYNYVQGADPSMVVPDLEGDGGISTLELIDSLVRSDVKTLRLSIGRCLWRMTTHLWSGNSGQYYYCAQPWQSPESQSSHPGVRELHRITEVIRGAVPRVVDYSFPPHYVPREKLTMRRPKIGTPYPKIWYWTWTTEESGYSITMAAVSTMASERARKAVHRMIAEAQRSFSLALTLQYYRIYALANLRNGAMLVRGLASQYPVSSQLRPRRLRRNYIAPVDVLNDSLEEGAEFHYVQRKKGRSRVKKPKP